jgi:hypothetical protein
MLYYIFIHNNNLAVFFDNIEGKRTLLNYFTISVAIAPFRPLRRCLPPAPAHSNQAIADVLARMRGLFSVE